MTYFIYGQVLSDAHGGQRDEASQQEMACAHDSSRCHRAGSDAGTGATKTHPVINSRTAAVEGDGDPIAT